MDLCLRIPEFYRVKEGQTLEEIAAAFALPPRLLAEANALTEPPQAGRVLRIPRERGNLYIVRGGESKSFLCGSPKRFEERNRTRCLYIGQKVFLR